MCSRKKVEVKILLISSPNLNFKLQNWNQTDCLHRTWNPDKIPDSTFHHAIMSSLFRYPLNLCNGTKFDLLYIPKIWSGGG